MNIYVIYKFDDYAAVKKKIDEIREVIPENDSIFMFEPGKTPNFWHRYADKKLKESQIVILFDSFSGDNDTVGKHILWEVKKAERLKKRIVVFKTDPESKNRAWYDKDYSDLPPANPRFKTVPMAEAVEFMRKECGWKIENNLLHNNGEDVSLADSDKQLLLEQYRIMIETSEKLMERRQETVNLYTTLCTTLIALIGASFAFSNVTICAVILWISGLILTILCHNWRLSLDSYDLNNTGKFKVINLLEQSLPAEIFECEYHYNQMKGIRSFSSREKVLPRIFSLLGVILMVFSGVMLIFIFLEKNGIL